MCEAFAKAGHEVTLLVPRRAKTPKVDPFIYVGADPVFKIVRVPCIDIAAGSKSSLTYWLRTLSFLMTSRMYLALHRHDLVYTRELPGTFLLKDFVYEVHDITPRMRARGAELLKHARAFVVLTSYIREELIAAGFSDRKIFVSPDAVDLRDFAHPEPKEVARERLGLPKDKVLALYIGRTDAWKGMRALYGAAKLLPSYVQIVVIGAEAGEIEGLRRENPNVIFVSYRPYKELANNQAAADILLLPNTAKNALSAKYTSPLKLFTYLASGKPIVASDIPSIREILDERTAVLVEPDNAEALSQGIRQIAEDRSLQTKIGECAKELARKFTWENRARTILGFIGKSE